MNIHESCLALIRVVSRFQRTLNRMCVQRIENANETRIRRTNTRASVYFQYFPAKQYVLLGAQKTSFWCVSFEIEPNITQFKAIESYEWKGKY